MVFTLLLVYEARAAEKGTTIERPAEQFIAKLLDERRSDRR